MIAKDKHDHAVYSFAAVMLAAFLMPPGWAALLVLAAGIGKEVIHDGLQGLGTAEWGDMVANTLGVLVALLLLGWWGV